MNISSVASSTVPQVIHTQNRPEGRIEGNKPDGDGDQDDGVRVNTGQQSVNTPQATGSLGSQVDLTA